MISCFFAAAPAAAATTATLGMLLIAGGRAVALDLCGAGVLLVEVLLWPSPRPGRCLFGRLEAHASRRWPVRGIGGPLAAAVKRRQPGKAGV